MKQLYYTGVGSRQTPPDILRLMRTIAGRFADMNLILRTGDARGADSAFNTGCCLSGHIYTAKDSVLNSINPYVTDALNIAEDIHPNWHAMGEYGQALHARNCFQVLGECLDNPSEFLVCWTPGGRKTGGTRTAIVLAERHNIPVFNLGDPSGLGELTMFVKGQDWYQALPSRSLTLTH